jgi:uncharacterized protein YceK
MEAMMSKGLVLLAALLLLSGCGKITGTPAPFDDIVKAVEALRASGCTALAKLKAESDGYEAEGVTCAEGKRYDIELDKNFAIVSKREDHI